MEPQRAHRSGPFWRWRAFGLAAALALAPRAAVALDTQGNAQAAVGTGYDSNAGHDLDGSAQGDGVFLGVLDLDGTLAPADSTLQLSGRYDLGAKRFYSLFDDDVVAQEASAQISGQLGPLVLGVDARAKDRRSRSGDRDYTDLGADANGSMRLGRVPLQLSVGTERFIYRPDAQYSFWGPTALATALVPLWSKQRLALTASGAFRNYGPESVDAAGLLRRDGAIGGGIAWRYRGTFLAELGYDFLADLSNQLGRSYQRHRISGSAAVFLPAELALAATAAVQRTDFPDGVALAPELLLATDDEATNSLTLALSRHFPHGLSVELKAAGYQADYATNGLAYHRALAQLSLGWEN